MSVNVSQCSVISPRSVR